MGASQKSKRKTAKKTAKARPALVPQPDGKGALLTGGMPGNAGGGRPPQALKDFLALLRKDPLAQAALETAARDSTSKNFSAAWKVASDYDDTRPAKKIEVNAPLSNAERAERIKRVLDRAKAS